MDVMPLTVKILHMLLKIHSGAKSISNFKMADVCAVSAQIIDEFLCGKLVAKSYIMHLRFTNNQTSLRSGSIKPSAFVYKTKTKHS